MTLPIPQEHVQISTMESIPGKRIKEYRGLARGNSIRSASLNKDVLARMKNLVGGEIQEYTKLLAECREEALDRMVEHAHSLGANGIVAMRFCTAEIAPDAAELLAYGTAVLVVEDS